MSGLSATLVSHGFQPNYEKAFSNGLAKRGVAVTLIGSDRTLSDQLELGIRFLNLRGSQQTERSRLEKAGNLLRYGVRLFAFLAMQRPQNLHLIGTLVTGNPVLGPLECLCYSLLSKRFTLTVHNLLPHDRHSALNRLIYRLIYALPHKLVVHTKRMKAQLNTVWKVPAERIVVMEHGVDELPATFQPWKPDPGNRIRLLLFGAVLRYKGIDTLLQALDHLNDQPITVDIVGLCRDAVYTEELEQLIASAPANHHIKWRQAYIAEDEVQGIFESADAVVLPYRHIDQSGVLLAAYRFGTPVIAFDVGAFADYITDHTGILAPDTTPLGLATGIRSFSKQMQHFRRDKIRSYARNYVWEKTVESLLSNYGH
ncbi:MAG: hypothetical protein CRU78_15055 [Candidatus Accumulibacter phosphatis]|uniref:Glycosyltransferase subfamily 4-like N-terminal domain-containing protein n=1 Tax=Candidatus Accumulibacter phosphatis TaxID=327160 RepID=A0A6A7RWJ5_9PROT|nr:hypothetical protein [Candidatus Accumulibacter phosphatis]